MRPLETKTHLLFQCDFSKKVWREALFTKHVDQNPCGDFNEGWRKVKKATCLPPVGIAGEDLVPWICWHLWKARNNLLFNDNNYTHSETLNKAIIDCKEWSNSQPGKSLKPQTIPIPRSTPKESSIICRSDAAWREENKVAELGWSFLKNQSEVISNHSKISHFVSSPLVAEGLALREAIEEAWTLGFRDLVVESASQILIKAITRNEKISEIYGILADIDSLAT